MLPILTAPLALIGLVTLPALVAIYVLRKRSRILPVSSLLLWMDPRGAPQGGKRVEKFRPTLLFWLEFFTLLMLVLSAALPFLPNATGFRPLIIVLDDSFSMQAGGSDSSRQRAVEALLEELRQRPRGSVRIILAGERAQLLGEDAHQTSEIQELLGNWNCQASAGRIDLALNLAFELGGNLASIIVLSDHAPPTNLLQGQTRIRWWAFGEPRPNWAIVNASRSAGTHGDRLLLEVANLANEQRSTVLHWQAGSPPQEVQRSELNLNARETYRVVLELPDASTAPTAVSAAIEDSELPFDNSVTLVALNSRVVRFENQLARGKLATAVDRAMLAAGGTKNSDTSPHLVFLEGETAYPDNDDAWLVRMVADSEAESFTGPFVLDRSHPLTEGLALSGVVWAGGKGPLAGSPVVMAGNTVLVADHERAGKHEIHFRLRQNLSTLTETPAWPELFWNLVSWRTAHLSGFDHPNIRLGEEVICNFSRFEEKVEVTGPGNEAHSIPSNGRRIALRPDRPGIYQVQAGGQTVELAVNPLNRDESDLLACITNRWGDATDETTLQLDYVNLMWLPVLIALALATLHLRLAAGSGTS